MQGDLAFFGRHDAHGYHTTHVGIDLANDNMIDACQTGTFRKGLRMLSQGACKVDDRLSV